MDPVHDISPGHAVFTEDGHQLGEVKQIDDHLIKVDAPLHPDYWLSRDDVLSFTNERVTLSFPLDDLDGHKRARD